MFLDLYYLTLILVIFLILYFITEILLRGSLIDFALPDVGTQTLQNLRTKGLFIILETYYDY
jgi:hypothetical protein